MKKVRASKRQLERYPIYLKLLTSLSEEGEVSISSPNIASLLGYSEEQVRKDLQTVTSRKGQPKRGRNIKELINDISDFLGYDKPTMTILVGSGHLGQAFLNFEGFNEVGLNIVAVFDTDEELIGNHINNIPIYDVHEMEQFIKKNKIEIAILTIPSSVALETALKLQKYGIKAIWNFAHVHLNLGQDVIVENVNLASSLAILSYQLRDFK